MQYGAVVLYPKWYEMCNVISDFLHSGNDVQFAFRDLFAPISCFRCDLMGKWSREVGSESESGVNPSSQTSFRALCQSFSTGEGRNCILEGKFEKFKEDFKLQEKGRRGRG